MKLRAGGKTEAKPAKLAAQNRRNLRLQGVVLGLAVGLLLAGAGGVGWHKLRAGDERLHPAATEMKSTNCEVLTGPWGELVLSHLLIERPKPEGVSGQHSGRGAGAALVLCGHDRAANRGAVPAE